MSRPKTIKIAICQNPECAVEFIVKHRQRGMFCSKSCSATINNRKRIKKQKELITLRCNKCDIVFRQGYYRKLCVDCRPKKRLFPITIKTEYKFTAVRICYCKICNDVFYNKTSIKFCSKHRNRMTGIRSTYNFNFNIYDYPELFDLDLVSRHGWYSTGSKRNNFIKNINGVSRDHRVSVSDAIKHNYDSYYIKHPMNCKIVLQKDNSSKNQKSEITYQELIRLVDHYDLVPGGTS